MKPKLATRPVLLLSLGTLSLASSLHAQAPEVSIFRGVSSGALYLASAPATTVVDFPEPQCNKSFEEELAWCQANAAGKCGAGTQLKVEGVDLATQFCAYELCRVTCQDPVVVPRFGSRLSDLEGTIIQRLDAMSGTPQNLPTIDSLSQQFNLLAHRLSELQKQLDQLKGTPPAK